MCTDGVAAGMEVPLLKQEILSGIRKKAWCWYLTQVYIIDGVKSFTIRFDIFLSDC